jgi:hypothetical protein
MLVSMRFFKTICTYMHIVTARIFPLCKFSNTAIHLRVQLFAKYAFEKQHFRTATLLDILTKKYNSFQEL